MFRIVQSALNYTFPNISKREELFFTQFVMTFSKNTILNRCSFRKLINTWIQISAYAIYLKKCFLNCLGTFLNNVFKKMFYLNL